jgi:predicted aldo/keto reductase-like oxidoreductase
MRRREFLKRATSGSLGAAVAAGVRAADSGRGAPRGRDAFNTEISIIGVGGNLLRGTTQSHADYLVSWAFDRGVNYFDFSPDYGNAEERLGPALRPYRRQCFLACKTMRRDAEGSRRDLEGSLRRLETDYFELYQLHALRTIEEVDEVMSPGGAMETLIRARDYGQVRFLGFSAHSVEAAMSAMERFPFDSILFPFNVVCMLKGNFGLQVLERARGLGMTCLAIKPMGWTPLPDGGLSRYEKCFYEPTEDPYLARLSISYTLDLPVASFLPPGDESLYRLALEIALHYRPLTEDERLDLFARARQAEPMWRYINGRTYSSALHSPLG